MGGSIADASATRAWQLCLRSPLHIGERGVALEETLEYIPSDSLFSALVVTWLEMAQQQAIVERIGAEFALRDRSDAPLLLTSAFPFAGDVLLLPRPRLALSPLTKTAQPAMDQTQEQPASRKKYKKVRWVSLSIFTQLISGIDQPTFDVLWSEGALIQGGTVWVTKTEEDLISQLVERNEDDKLFIWGEQNTPKVTIDRTGNASTLFHVGRLHFAPSCGLWLMASGETLWLDRTEDALRLLADSGIGGQRSRGNGQFVLQPLVVPTLPINDPKAEYCVLLSRLAPRQEEMDLLRQDSANYQLVTVGGFNGTPSDQPLVRQQVRLLTEGSVIGQGARMLGKLVNVNPFWDEQKQQLKADIDRSNPKLPLIEHPIYRYGFGFTVPVIMPQQEATG